MATFAEREAFLSARLDGPKDFVRALGRAEKQTQRDFRSAVRGVARPIRDDARARYRGRYRQRTGRSVKGITSAERAGSAVVQLQRTRPHLVGQEWGGYAARFHPHGMPQIRGGTSGVGGTFLWPAREAGIAAVERETLEALDTAVATLRGRGG